MSIASNIVKRSWLCPSRVAGIGIRMRLEPSRYTPISNPAIKGVRLEFSVEKIKAAV
jgi:hypothetical protein